MCIFCITVLFSNEPFEITLISVLQQTCMYQPETCNIASLMFIKALSEFNMNPSALNNYENWWACVHENTVPFTHNLVFFACTAFKSIVFSFYIKKQIPFFNLLFKNKRERKL